MEEDNIIWVPFIGTERKIKVALKIE